METYEKPLDEKQERLYGLLGELGKEAYLAVAFSGGVDSSFLLSAASDLLHDKAFAVMAVSPFIPRSEIDEAEKLACQIGARLIEVKADVLEDPTICRNDNDRCFHCKKRIFGRISEAASKHVEEACGCQARSVVVDGTNKDDEKDYRPGMRALEELGVKSPLRDAGLTKADIRGLSRRRGLCTWKKPAYACLATRIPANTEITLDKIRAVEQAEDVMHGLGFSKVRVRHHGDIARIELDESDIARFMEGEKRKTAAARFKEIGFKFTTIDVEGYKMGSMN